VSDLLTVKSITEEPGTYIRRHGTVVAEFNHLNQDSGNVSWLVEVAARRLFVKTAGPVALEATGVASAPSLNHHGRVRLLRNAIDLASSCRHPALPGLLNVIESPSGPALIYEGAEGELVGVTKWRRDDPASPYQRFAHLGADLLLGVFDVLIDLHVALAAAGWVGSDLYDGCLIFNFPTGQLTVVDLDSYRRGPSINDMGRMFGSTRFMAPEEFELGAVIDECTTVFNLGRIVWHFGTHLTERAEDFCGPPALAQVVQKACRPSPDGRPTSVASFAEAWRIGRGLSPG
jgi:serine/threonine-protein kinase